MERPRVVHTLGMAHMGISKPTPLLHWLPLRALVGGLLKIKEKKIMAADKAKN